MVRRFLYAILLLCTVLVLAALALWLSASWWIPRWLPLIAERYGVGIEALEIDDNGNWRAESVRYQHANWQIVADGVAIPSPLRWGWSLWQGTVDQVGDIRVAQLLLKQGEQGGDAESDFSLQELSPASLWQQLESAHELIARWLPPMYLASWHFNGLQPAANISGADWSYANGALRGHLSFGTLAPDLIARVAVLRSAEASWAFDLVLEGNYMDWEQPLESVSLELSCYLMETHLLLRALQGKGSWFEAHLSRPVQMDFRGPTINEDARLMLEVDLSGQSIIPLEGQFSGWLDFTSGVLDLTGQGALAFGGQVSQLVYREFPELSADLRGHGDWNGVRLQLHEATLSAQHDEYGELQWSGQGSWQMQGNVASASGAVVMRNALASVSSEIVASYEGDTLEATIESLSLVADDLPVLMLMEPLSVRLPKVTEGQWRLLELDPLVLSAAETGTHLRAAWQPEQALSLSLRNLPLRLFSPWLDIPETLKELQVESFELKDFNWQNDLDGSVELSVSLAAVKWQEAEISTQAELAVNLSTDGLRVDRLEWIVDDVLLASGALHLPLRFMIPQAPSKAWLQLSDPAQWQGALSLNVPTRAAEWLAEASGVTLGESIIEFSVEGEGEAVAMFLEVSIDQVQLPAREGLDANALIAERIALSLRADREKIVLEQALVSWGGGRLAATAELPIDELIAAGHEVALERLRSGEWLDWLTADVDLDQFSVAFWQDLLPPIVRPDGRLQGRLSVRPGRDFSGELIASDFALRPTLTVQAVESIQARIILDGSRIEVRDAGARIGGSSAKLLGYIDFSQRDRLEWNLQLSGDNLPLVRTVNMLLRADVDLRLQNDANTEFVPLINGRVDLRSSSLWVQFDPLAPRPAGRTRGPEPPFFHLEQAFLMHWQLDIQFAGNRFLRVRNPWFAAEMGASFLLTGTLGEPLLTGVLVLESGVLRMPAMNMRFDRGEIFITPDESNEIQLELSATGQRANHVITVDARGTVRNPQLQFRAIPDLTQGQILRILTTGGLENTGAGSLGVYLGRGFLGPAGTDGGLADRLQLDYGRAVSESGRNTIDIEWMLTERTFIRGQYDEYDAYNLDFLWRILRR